VKNMNEIKIEIPVKPMSVNVAWQGRRFKTRVYKNYQECLGWHLKKYCDLKIRDEVEMVVEVHLQNKTYAQSDVDNFLKPLLDTLVEYKVLDNDRFVRKLTVEKMSGESNWINILIKKYE